MKRYFKSALFAACVALAAGSVGCTDNSIEVGKAIDETPYGTIGESNGFILDASTGLSTGVADIYADGFGTTLKFGVTKAAAGDITATATVDEAYLAAYNAANETDYALYPAANVTFGANGTFTIKGGATASTTVPMTVTKADGLDAAKTYAIPVALNVAGDAVKVKPQAGHCLYVVRDMTSLAGADKGAGITKGMVMWDGGVNPLNTLAWELEDGRLLFDMLVLFSSNINYNTVEGRPYLTHNQEILWAYSNRETVLVPLQKRGVKVILSILGNHDMAGVAQLSESAAKDFAAEVAAFVYTNELDGVFLDDEYSQSPDLSNPCFVSRSSGAVARLFHELKKAMPDKLTLTYEYSTTTTYSMQSAYSTIADVGEYVDIAVSDYPTAPARPIGTLGIDGCTRIAMDVAAGRGSNLTVPIAEDMLAQKYGWYMVFGLGPDNFTTAYNRISPGIETLYGSKLKVPSVKYDRMTATPSAI